MLQNKKFIITAVTLTVLLVILVSAAYFLSRKKPVTQQPRRQVIEDIRQKKLTESQVVEKLPMLFNEPVSYGNIEIEYKADTKTYAVYFTGTEAAARLSVEVLFDSYGIKDAAKLPLVYVDVNPLKDAPPKGFNE